MRTNTMLCLGFLMLFVSAGCAPEGDVEASEEKVGSAITYGPLDCVTPLADWVAGGSSLVGNFHIPEGVSEELGFHASASYGASPSYVLDRDAKFKLVVSAPGAKGAIYGSDEFVVAADPAQRGDVGEVYFGRDELHRLQGKDVVVRLMNTLTAHRVDEAGNGWSDWHGEIYPWCNPTPIYP